MDYFLNRDKEIRAFKEALDDLLDAKQKPPVLLYNGVSGMGKTWLLKECLRIATKDERQPFMVFIDCNRTNMTLEVLFNEIHTALEADFLDYFDEYLKFLEKIEEIEKAVEEEATAKPENAQKIASVISAVATKSITSTVPGAAVATFVGEQNIGQAMDSLAGGIADGITSLRRKFARRKLDREKYRFFLKDLQAEQTKKLAEILNKIADKENRKLILLVDRFEKLAVTPNVRSDIAFYQYWRDFFVPNLSENILLVQCGRTNFGDDYQLHLPERTVRSFELKPFTEGDISKILQQLKILRQQMQQYENFVKLLFEKTDGFPVAVGLVQGQIQELSSADEVARLKDEILLKEANIIEQSIRWFLDNSLDPQHRDTVYKLAVCCSSSGKIDKTAIEYIFKKSNMSFPEVEAALHQLSQQYSFIDCIQWTMHELARKFILRHLKLKNKEYIRQVNNDLRVLYRQQSEEKPIAEEKSTNV
jgi:hypothetical protein